MNIQTLKFRGLVAAITLLIPTTITSAAITGGYGVSVSAGTASNCPSFCTSGDGGQFESDMAGDEFVTAAVATENSFGMSQAQAFYSSANTYLPVLKTFASSGLGKGADATAFSVQGFTFDGDASLDVDLQFELDASITDGEGGYSSNSASAGVSVFRSSDQAWFPDFATLVFEVASGENLGTEQIGLSDPGANQSVDGSLQFTLNPGDDFYVIAEMTSSSRNGTADAFNTFTMSFNNDTTSLFAASNAASVPEPSSLSLLALAIGAAALRRRR